MRRFVLKIYDRDPAVFWVLALTGAWVLGLMLYQFHPTFKHELMNMSWKPLGYALLVYFGLYMFIPRYKRDPDGVVYDRFTGYYVDPVRKDDKGYDI